MITVAGTIVSMNSETITPELKSISEKTEETMSPQNIESLCDHILKANKKLDEMSTSVQSKVQKILEQLENFLQALQVEDEEYHKKEKL
jgi:NAD+--asparagine ADP-ribosyltransferase